MPKSRPPIRILAHASVVPILAREFDRRRFLGLVAAAGGTALLAACAPGGSSSSSPQASGGEVEDSLSIFTWGEYDDPAVIEAFTADVGPRVEFGSYSSNEELISKLVAANGTSGYDIVVPTGPFVPQMVQNGLLTALNKDLIPNLEFVDPQFLGRDWDPENEYTICKAFGTTGFAYDTTVITRDLVDWNDFFDAAQNEASGRTSMLDEPVSIVGSYLWANGEWQSTEDTALLDAAEEFLTNEIAPHIAAFEAYPGTNAIPQNGQALCQAYNGDARLGILSNADPERWKWVLGSPTSEIWMDNWAIAAGAPHPEAAHAFINYVLEPDVALAQVAYVGYNTGGRDVAQAATDDGVERTDIIFPTEAEISTLQTSEINEAQQRTVDIWNNVKAAAGA